MGKDTHFTGQPIFGQLLSFLNKGQINRTSKELGADKYVKRFTSYKHVVVMLFATFEGYHSIRDTVLVFYLMPISSSTWVWIILFGVLPSPMPI